MTWITFRGARLLRKEQNGQFLMRWQMLDFYWFLALRLRTGDFCLYKRPGDGHESGSGSWCWCSGALLEQSEQLHMLMQETQHSLTMAVLGLWQCFCSEGLQGWSLWAVPALPRVTSEPDAALPLGRAEILNELISTIKFCLVICTMECRSKVYNNINTMPIRICILHFTTPLVLTSASLAN